MNRSRTRVAIRARERRFRIIVDRVVRTLPHHIQTLLDDVAIIVQDEPTTEQLRDVNARGTLFGLYQGVPKTVRTSGYSLIAPDRMTIFMGPLTRSCPSRDALEDQIRITVLHELGHHLGFDELGLDRIGLS